MNIRPQPPVWRFFRKFIIRKDGPLISTGSKRLIYVLRAMVLPAGTHTVEFRFRAPHYELLSSLTLISSLLLLGGVAAVAGAAGYRAYKKRKDNDGQQ